MENRFNLVDEAWIPVADTGRVSLRQLFSHPEYRALGGNPIQKLALMKLLLAIAQAAATPNDENEWRALGPRGMADACLRYLDQWHDRFWLYGEQPFLQMPAIAAAREQNFGALLPEVATGNTTVLHHSQVERALSDPDRALLLLTLMAFALAGKKTDNSVILTPGYAGKTNARGKPSSGRPGTAIEYMGLLHSHLLAGTLHETLWLDLFSHEQISASKMYPEGLGVPPWEQMPEGEDCPVAQKLKQSLMGRLIPLSRFCLLTETGMHYSEGLQHPGYKDGVADPTVAVDFSGKQPKALWTDPEKRPWRELTSLLGFLEQDRDRGYQCWQLAACLERARDVCERVGIWSGGLRVSSNAGEQYASGRDDFVESVLWLYTDMLGETWFVVLKLEMSALEQVARYLYGRVSGYYKDQKMDAAGLAELSTSHFWQLCEQDFQALVDGCDQAETRQQLRRRFASYLYQAFDRYCPRDTARQLDAWTHNRPNLYTYLNQES
jgi:CRISPR system Cascade subunit CasA